MRYMVKRTWEGEARALIRMSGQSQQAWTPKGWVPSNTLEYTGIGGSADWDDITEAEARDVIVELAGNDST